MSKRNTISHNRQLDIFYKTSRKIFGEQYLLTGKRSVLVAQNMLESAVDKRLVAVDDAMETFRNPAIFAKVLLDAETDEQNDDQNDERQKLHKRMAKIERSTHWAIAVGLGLTFLAAGPFASVLLQPTAEELFKRKPAAQSPATPQPQTTQNITNNTYNFYTSAATTTPAQQPGASKVDGAKFKGTLTCKNMTINAYRLTLSELLKSNNVVTLGMSGKKVSMCYRPYIQRPKQQQVLTHK